MTEEAGPAAVSGRASRRRMVAALASVGAHGALVLAISLIGVHAVRETPTVSLTPIQFVEPAPPAPARPPPPTFQPVVPPSPGTLGRRGREAPRSMSRAPADPYAELVMHYDAPRATSPGNRDGSDGIGLGSGLQGEGVGGWAFGAGSLPPPAPSLARPPRAKEDYSQWDFRAARMFRGAVVRLELSIDPRGVVRGVRIVKGVDNLIDERAADLARHFEFYPALDDDGQPIWGRHGWEFVIR